MSLIRPLTFPMLVKSHVDIMVILHAFYYWKGRLFPISTPWEHPFRIPWKANDSYTWQTWIKWEANKFMPVVTWSQLYWFTKQVTPGMGVNSFSSFLLFFHLRCVSLSVCEYKHAHIAYMEVRGQLSRVDSSFPHCFEAGSLILPIHCSL